MRSVASPLFALTSSSAESRRKVDEFEIVEGRKAERQKGRKDGIGKSEHT